MFTQLSETSRPTKHCRDPDVARWSGLTTLGKESARFCSSNTVHQLQRAEGNEKNSMVCLLAHIDVVQ
jgi:hypothetical protein